MLGVALHVCFVHDLRWWACSDPSRLSSALLDTGLAGDVTVGVVGSSHSGTRALDRFGQGEHG